MTANIKDTLSPPLTCLLKVAGIAQQCSGVDSNVQFKTVNFHAYDTLHGVTVCPSAALSLYPKPMFTPLFTSLALKPPPLYYVSPHLPQPLFTEIESLGLMFKASVQLSGRLLEALVVDVISVSLLLSHTPPFCHSS